MEAKVSIIIPVYNSEKYLEKCIETVLLQTYQNIEVILVNDGSKDSSLDIIKKYEKEDNRVKSLSRENKGQLQTRKDGLEMSMGEYITFLDADDWIDIHMIENMMKISKKYNADIVRCNYIDEHIEENRHVVNKPAYENVTYITKQEFKEKIYPIFLATHQINSIWGQLIRKEVIKNYEVDQTIRIAEDLLFNLNLYEDVKDVVFIPEPYYHYRSNDESITNKKSISSIQQKVDNIIRVYTRYYQYIKEWQIDTTENRKIITQRIFKEVEKKLNELYTFSNSYQEKLSIIRYTSEKLKKSQIDSYNEKSDFRLQDKWLIQNKYTKLIVLKFFQYKMIYDLKKTIKKMLVIINKGKQKNGRNN